jgi:hypothetical protein
VVHFDYLSLVLHESATDTMRLHVQEACEPVPPNTVIVLPAEDDSAGVGLADPGAAHHLVPG